MNMSVCLPPEKYRSAQESLDECERELNVRKRCYDKWVAEGKLSRSEAIDRYQRLCTACMHLSRLAAQEKVDRMQPTPAPQNITNLPTELAGETPAARTG